MQHAQKTFSKILNYDHPPRRSHRASTTAVDDAVLQLAAGLMDWVRPQDRKVPAFDVHSALLGSKDMVVITIGAAM